MSRSFLSSAAAELPLAGRGLPINKKGPTYVRALKTDYRVRRSRGLVARGRLAFGGSGWRRCTAGNESLNAPGRLIIVELDASSPMDEELEATRTATGIRADPADER